MRVARPPKTDRAAAGKEITYGPVQSRRLGVSLGLDLAPAAIKPCPLDCLYCQCGRTDARIVDASERPELVWPTPSEVEQAVRHALRRCARVVHDISLCGTGEPTLHPRFNDVARRVMLVRDELAPRASLSIFTCAMSTAVATGAALPGILCCDRRFVKLDVGSDKALRRLAHPAKSVELRSVVEAISKIPDAEVQSMIVSGASGNDSDEAIEEWADLLSLAQPMWAEVMTISRPAAEPLAVKPTTAERLNYAARLAFDRGIPTFVVEPQNA